MSHRTEVKTNLNNQEYLEKALTSLGYKFSTAKEGKLTTRSGYIGGQKVDILIHEKNGRKTGDAVGFVRGKDGNFTAVGDFYGSGLSQDGLRKDLLTEAKKLEATDRLMELGYSLQTSSNNSQELELVFTKFI